MLGGFRGLAGRLKPAPPGASTIRQCRAGVHIGECDPTALDGPVVETSTRLAEAARPGSVLVSRTIVDLVAGSGLAFAPIDAETGAALVLTAADSRNEQLNQ